MKTTLIRWAPPIAAAAVIAICQCVFFNVFYNAKTSYDSAYRDHRKLLKNNPDSIVAVLPSDIQANYDRAIEKAEKVLEEYPKSKKWHDDALFLMGKAYFYKGNYEKSLRILAGLQEDFPASPFIPESFLYAARDYVRLGSLDKADATLAMIMEKYPHLNGDEEVSLLMAEVALGREGKSLALDLLEKTIANVKSRERKIDLSIRCAGLAMGLKQYDKAIAILKNCPRDKKYPDKLFLLDMTLVGCWEAKDSLRAAMKLTNHMLNNKLFGAFVPYILLKKASISVKMDNIDEAIATYVSITDVYAPAPAPSSTPAAASTPAGTKGGPPPSAAPVSTPAPASTAAPNPATTGVAAAAGQAAAGTALYELGMIYQTKKGDFVKAKEYFSRAVTAAQDTVIRAHATQRVKTIDSLFAYRTIKDTADTSKGMGRRNAFDFKIGELFWLEMDLPDSACAHFKRLATAGDSLRPKALYSASYIYRSGLKDTAASDSLFKILLKEFPSNAYTQKAQIDRGEKVTVRTRADSALWAYMSAESLFCYVDSPEQAATAFKNVYALYPDCKTGIKALYASAWINDEALKNNKTAYKLYRTLCDSFPKCEICTTAVKPRLKTVSDTLAARKARGAKIKPATSPPVAAISKPIGKAPPAPAAQVKRPAPAPTPPSAVSQTDSLSDIKDREPKRSDSLRGGGGPPENYRGRVSRQVQQPIPPVVAQPATAPPPQGVKETKGSISEDTAAAAAAGAKASPKVEPAPSKQEKAAAVAPPASPKAIAPPVAPAAPVAPPPQPTAPKPAENPKTDSKADHTDSVEVIGQPGK